MRSKLHVVAGLTLLVVAGAAVAYATAGRAKATPEPTGGYVCPVTGETLDCPDCCPLNAKQTATTECCDDDCCPPGCCEACPPDCKDVKAKAPAKESCCDDGCCPPSKSPVTKKYTCPPCPLCPGW